MFILLPFFKILPVLLLALMSPGPSFLMVSSLSFARGRLVAVQCAAGMGACDFVYAGLSLLGLGILFQKEPTLLAALEILGGGYLIYIGYLMGRSSLKPRTIDDQPTKTVMPQRNGFSIGFQTNMTNPKVIVFFGSLFTMTLEPTNSLEGRALLPALCGLTVFAWYAFVAAVLSLPRVRKHYEMQSGTIDKIAAIILAAFGADLVFEAAQRLLG